LLQTVAANQPIYTDSSYLGYPAVRVVSPIKMTGTNTVLKSPVNSCSVFSRMSADNGAGANSFFDGGNGSTTNGLSCLLSNNFRLIYRSPYANTGGDSIQSSAGIVPSGTYFTFMGVRNSSSNNQIIYKDNSVVGTLSSLTQPAMPATNMTMTYGGNAGVTAMTGYLFAVILFPYALTSTQRAYLQSTI
jgi:hypothetical protein